MFTSVSIGIIFCICIYMYVCDLATFLIEAGVVIQHHRVNVCLCYSVENSDGNLDKKKLRKINVNLTIVIIFCV